MLNTDCSQMEKIDMDIARKPAAAVPLFLSLLLTLPASQSYAKPGSLKQCQRVQDRIERYTHLRRAGGSAKKMASWQKKRNHYKDLYSKYHCSRFRNKLK